MKQAVWTPMHEDGSLDYSELDQPTDTEEPTTWEVPLFHGGATVGDIAAVFGIMAGCPRHTFRVLVQDVAAMADWFSWVEGFEHVDPVSVCEIEAANQTDVDQLAPSWPLPNVTLISPVIRTQAEADKVLPALLAVKAARREAVFAPRELIDLWSVRWGEWRCPTCGGDGMDGGSVCKHMVAPDDFRPNCHAIRVRGGTGSRCIEPMSTAAVRQLRDMAAIAGIEFTLSWGRWVPIPDGDDGPNGHLFRHIDPDTWFQKSRKGGCTLDGVDYPEVL
jgi:hypothetical protein